MLKRKNILSPYVETKLDITGGGKDKSSKKIYPMLPYETATTIQGAGTNAGKGNNSFYETLRSESTFFPYSDVMGSGISKTKPGSGEKINSTDLGNIGLPNTGTIVPGFLGVNTTPGSGIVIPNLVQGTPTTPGMTTPSTESDPFALYNQVYNPYSFDSSAYSSARGAASSTYKKLVEEAEKAAKQKEVYADTRRALMNKYMDDTMNAMGLSDTGLASQAAISMDNNYNQYVMGAKSEAEAAKEDAMYNYRQALMEISSQEAAAQQASKQQQQQYELSLLQMAASGQYDWDYIQYVGGMYGLTEEQMQGVYSTFQNQESKTYANMYSQAFNQAATWTGTKEGFVEYLNSLGITGDDQNKILTEYDRAATERETGEHTEKWWSAYDVVTTTTDNRDVVEKWLKDQGFNEEDIASLLGYYDKAATERETEKTEAEDNTALYNEFFAYAEEYTGSRQAFENYVKSQGFTEEQVSSIMANYDENNVKVKAENDKYSYENLKALWDNGNHDTQLVDKALEKGIITPQQRGEFIRMYNDSWDTENYFAEATSKSIADKMYNNAMNNDWMSTDTKTEIYNSYKKWLEEYNADEDADRKEVPYEDQITLQGMGVNLSDTSSVIDPQHATIASVYGIIDVKRGDKQNAYINRILEVSKKWDNSMNGTLVSFNYGAGNPKGEIFVYWNGRWYQTDFIGANDAKKQTGNPVYGNKNGKYADWDQLFG